MSTPCFICDIDGTLADICHRLHFVLPGGKRDWDAFFEQMGKDGVIEPVRTVVKALWAQGHHIVLSSGRPDNYRQQTLNWLNTHGIPFSGLYMRPAGDVRADHIVKEEMLFKIRADGFEPLAVIDDRVSVTAMWRRNGLLCFQVAASEPEIPEGALLTLMIGPSGGGKSTWLASPAAEAFGIHPSHVISSDQVRADLCGDFKDQSRNQQVFAAIHELASARLRHGLPTVIDATHLRRKDRMTAAALSPHRVRYIVIDRPMEDKRRDGGWRNELSIDLLAKHAQTLASQIKDILAGDGLPNVVVHDLRGEI